ncbi:MAG: hypothetical protein ACPF9D_11470 [Owenweeksia sp.]
MKKDDQPLLLEFPFTVEVRGEKNASSGSIKKDLHFYFLERRFLNPRFSEKDLESGNTIQQVINDRLDRHFRFMGNSKAYLANYREKEGSLILSFAVVVYLFFKDYDSVRNGIDRFSDDLEDLLNPKSNSTLRTKVSYKKKKISKGKHKTESAEPVYHAPQPDLPDWKRMMVIFITSILMGLLGGVAGEELDILEDEPSKTEVELMILRELQSREEAQPQIIYLQAPSGEYVPLKEKPSE